MSTDARPDSGPNPDPVAHPRSGEEDRVFEFGHFEFRAASGDLASPGQVLQLAPQPASTLCALLERAGQVVTREELGRRLWPDGFVEADLGINHCMRQVRRALADDAVSPTYIETLRRRGYRFIEPVVERTERTRIADREVAIEPERGAPRLPSGRPVSVGQVYAFLDPTETGYRLRLAPFKGSPRTLKRMGVAGLTMGLILLAFLLALKGALPPVLLIPVWIVVALGGALASHMLDVWARERARLAEPAGGRASLP